VQRDPLALLSKAGGGFQDGMNLFAYLGLGLLTNSDPTGLTPIPPWEDPWEHKHNPIPPAPRPAPTPCSPNGCTAVPDAPLGYNFKPCCDKHDMCYCTCGVTREQCDLVFCGCLLGRCGTKCLWVPTPCRAAASAYCLAVKLFGESYYNRAQVMAGCR
jgi:secretory phospholipase A2